MQNLAPLEPTAMISALWTSERVRSVNKSLRLSQLRVISWYPLWASGTHEAHATAISFKTSPHKKRRITAKNNVRRTGHHVSRGEQILKENDGRPVVPEQPFRAKQIDFVRS